MQIETIVLANQTTYELCLNSLLMIVVTIVRAFCMNIGGRFLGVAISYRRMVDDVKREVNSNLNVFQTVSVIMNNSPPMMSVRECLEVEC